MLRNPRAPKGSCISIGSRQWRDVAKGEMERKSVSWREQPAYLMHGKVYDVTAVENGWYRIVDEEQRKNPYEDIPSGYLYPPELFEIVEE